MSALSTQFLQFLEKDIKDWEDAAAFFDKIHTVKMDRQVYRKGLCRTIPRKDTRTNGITVCTEK